MTGLTAETWRFIEEHRNDDVRKLALQARKYPEVEMNAAITQIAGRQSIAQKVPSWHAITGLLYPPHLSLEQCSSEITATYKSSLLSGETFADLTGGFGIDCAFLSRKFSKAAYVERQEILCEIARHNFSRLGLTHIDVHHQESEAYLQKMPPVDCLFVDPARRDHRGGKTVAVSDCEPDVSRLEELLLAKSRKVLIKLSPMLDLTLALQSLPHTCEVHIVSVQNECKELLLLLQSRPAGEVPIHCINFAGGEKEVQSYCFTQQEESRAEAICTQEPEAYLYEPNASVLKAGAFKSIAQRFSVRKLHPNSHLYTSETLVDGFPGRSFRVNGYFSLKDKALTTNLSKANISTRNFPSTPAELRKRLKLTDGGETYLFATTLANGKKVILRCEKV